MKKAFLIFLLFHTSFAGTSYLLENANESVVKIYEKYIKKKDLVENLLLKNKLVFYKEVPDAKIYITSLKFPFVHIIELPSKIEKVYYSKNLNVKVKGNRLLLIPKRDFTRDIVYIKTKDKLREIYIINSFLKDKKDIVYMKIKRSFPASKSELIRKFFNLKKRYVIYKGKKYKLVEVKDNMDMKVDFIKDGRAFKIMEVKKIDVSD